MAWKYRLLAARGSSAANPLTVSVTTTAEDSVLVLLLKGVGGTDRAGGSPTWNGQTLTQASTTQKAAASPEASAELWYLLNPGAATANVSIPNSGAITVFRTVVAGQAPAGGGAVALINVAGSNNTSANPSPGAIYAPEGNAIYFAVAASGATTWAPSAQAGTVIANTDDGAHGGGEQYLIQDAPGSVTMSWTQGSDDWGAVAAAFGQSRPPHRLNNLEYAKGGETVLSFSERIR